LEGRRTFYLQIERNKVDFLKGDGEMWLGTLINIQSIRHMYKFNIKVYRSVSVITFLTVLNEIPDPPNKLFNTLSVENRVWRIENPQVECKLRKNR